MGSEPKGLMYIPVWVDDGIVKVLVNDDGQIPVKESSPLTNIQSRLYGFDDPDWVPVPSQANGELHVRLQSVNGTVLIQQYMPSLLQPGVNTHISGDWQKQPMIHGISDALGERDYNLTASAGSNTLTVGNVPAGEMWVFTRLSAVNLNNAITGLAFASIIDSVEYRLGQVSVRSAYQSFDIQGPIYLSPGDRAHAYFTGCTLNDDLYFWATGYRMDIDL